MQQADSLPTEPGDVLPPAHEEFEPLDPRVLGLWRVSHLIVSAVLFLALLVLGAITAAALPAAWPWVPAVGLALAALRTWLLFGYLPRAYGAWGYQIGEKVLLIRSGVWFRVLRLLPLSRLQHVDIHRGPLERRFGLASLMLYTAGSHAAVLEIPGLDAGEAVRLRDRLVAAGGDDAV